MPLDLGATMSQLGTTFRVWAPSANQVDVLIQLGEEWDASGVTSSVSLATVDGEYWEATVPGIGEDHIYRYQLQSAGTTFMVIDPAARDTVHSWNYFGLENNRNAARIEPKGPFAWAPFDTPRFPDFLIYQLHVGSFAGRGDGLGTPARFDDVAKKFGYVRELGFTAIELLPIQEFSADRSWGYNPALYFAPESSYGSPADLRRFVDAAHQHGLAVIFDVVFNHAGPQDNSLWEFDGSTNGGGIYFQGGQMTFWGRGPALGKPQVQDFFFQNACMYFDEFNADGLRFDATTQMNGVNLASIVDRLRQRYPSKYFIAEHLPAHPWITTFGRFAATWDSNVHHECQRALAGDDPVHRVLRILGWDGFDHAWNVVKYVGGSHDDVGDQENGDAEHGLTSWDARHRYLVDQLGGRDDWHARSKVRLGWALNVAMPGTPMAMMGTECLMGAPGVAWGYWHDGSDLNGDHRFDWTIAGDPLGASMRRLVADANAVRRRHGALRADTLQITHVDHENGVLAFKRWNEHGSVVLTVVNLSERSFTGFGYGVRTGGQQGRWRQVLCTQDAEYGGWDGAGNAFHDPFTQGDGSIYINLPKWSVVLLQLLE